ncbi:hypothetical protein I4U23_017489 [Adineta vaga]|nr:hypothetical protein I4U23_017489 [Adineta vaga]
MLKITVHNIECVSDLEYSSNINLLVTFNFHGNTKQINWQRSSSELPKSDQKIEFSLNDLSIKPTDILEIHLEDHEKIGNTKHIDHTQVPLNEVIRIGLLKQCVLIKNTKLYLTLEYSSSNMKNEINNEILWKSDWNTNQLFQSRSTKSQDFQIRVKIFQARQLDGSNIHPICRVRIQNLIKQTKIQKGTNHPYFNEVFFFNINLSERDLCDEIIEFEVCNSKTFRSDMKIGRFKLDISYIYSQKKHSINRKWLLLCNEDDQAIAGKGYLKVSVNILGPGDEAPAQENEDDEDDIESNLLKPAGLILRPATFILKVYKAEDLPRMDSAFLNGVKKIFYSTEDVKELIDPYVKFSFAGQQVSSKIVYTCSHPEFNQELRLGLKFPSMCDKITLTIMDWDRLQFDDVTGTTLLDIHTICDDRENGFLPTFGPCWINFYGAPREYSGLPTALDDLNNGKDEGVAYRGRLLIELQTILGETPKESLSDLSNSDITRTLPYQSRKKYRLHAAFLDASMVYDHESSIEFEISIGNYGNKYDNLMENGTCSTTPPTNPVFDGTSYNFLPWEHTKPCVQVTSEWEDITFRLESMNQLLKIKLFINGILSTLDLLKTKKLSEEVLLKNYKQSLDMIISHLKKPLPDFETGRYYLNELDRLRRQMREKDLYDMNLKLEELKIHAKTSQEIIQTLEDIRQKLEYLQFEPQNSIPDVIIWLLANGKRYAYYRLSANEVFYSVNPDRCGHLCGKVQTVTLKWPGKQEDVEKDRRLFIPAEIRVKIWFGLAIYEQDWLSQQKGADLAIYAETYENQTNVLGQWTTTGPLMTRPIWSDVTGNMNLLKNNFQVPDGWRWDGDWYISPEISARYADDAGHRKFTEEIYEHQSRLIAGAQWQPKAIGWTNLVGDKVPSKDERNESPEGWQWEDDWTIDTNRAVDEGGFEYCVNQTLSGWCPVERLFHLTRRRRWYRTRILRDDYIFEDKKKRATAIDLSNGGWEYAPMFNMKFHADERSLDMTRRRRWHRKMVPDSSFLDENLSTNGAIATADIVFRMQTQIPKTRTDDSSTVKTKDIKIELSAPRMFLSFKKPYYYELRVYLYQARNLLSMDYDSFSDPYAQIGFINQSQRSEIIQKTLCPTWDQTLIFSNVELYGEPDEIHHNPPNILIEFFDKDEYGSPDFLGRVQCSPVVRLTPDETKPMIKLKWLQIMRGKDQGGELLAAFELFLLPENDTGKTMPPYPSKRGSLFTVPEPIRPKLIRTGIEILCWGVRNMKTFMLSDIDCPQVIFEVGGQQIESTMIKNIKKTPNFDKPLLFLDVMLPNEDLYTPPMNIKVRDHRSFGRKPIVGYHILKSLELFRCDPTIPSLKLIQASKCSAALAELPVTDVVVVSKKKKHRKKDFVPSKSYNEYSMVIKPNENETKPLDKKIMKKRIKNFLRKHKLSPSSVQSESKLSKIQKLILKSYQNIIRNEPIVEDDIDWWSKYYASKGQSDKCGTYLEKGYEKLKIYPSSLESLEFYEGFNDFCQTFQLYRGKTKFEEENEIVGEFKGLFRVYSLPEKSNETVLHHLMSNFPSNSLEECLIRIYIIRGIDLQPKDSNGKSDPYIEIQLGKIRLDNRNEKIANTTNPIFGKLFEIKTIIPLAKDLTIQNRLLSKYRATCGLPLQYNLTGPNQWRDNHLPRKILTDVCKRNHLPLPELHDDHSIQIGDSIFRLEDFEQEKSLTTHAGEGEERLALYILHKLQLCPEHIETRPLYNSLQPSIEQGRLELFVDIFPLSQGPPGPPFVITPRKPKPYVLRCIIWNTSNVILQETSITGEQMSDIYVKGWMIGKEDDLQKTDVHYRSMDGEGNFNWRFVYEFLYFPAERCLSINKKEHFWSYDSTELKLPPILNLQIWDNDKFSSDDFLGALTLDLNHLYKPAKDADVCTLDILNDQQSNCVSIFDIKRLKGWWPCVDLQDGNSQLTGKIEIELEILTEEEANERPAGHGREKPNQHPKLELPQRPETSFLWFTSPYRTFKNIIWKKSKWYLLGLLILTCIIIFILLFLWSIPVCTIAYMKKKKKYI